MMQFKQWRARLLALKRLVVFGTLGLILSANSLQAQTLRWFGTLGNADLLIVLFNFGRRCD